MLSIVENKKPDVGAFIYVYRNWSRYGKGDMLCYINNKKCDYVLFKSIDENKTEIINEDLLELFKEGAE